VEIVRPTIAIELLKDPMRLQQCGFLRGERIIAPLKLLAQRPAQFVAGGLDVLGQRFGKTCRHDRGNRGKMQRDLTGWRINRIN
jgi:hypothetical protein